MGILLRNPLPIQGLHCPGRQNPDFIAVLSLRSSSGNLTDLSLPANNRITASGGSPDRQELIPDSQEIKRGISLYK